MVTNNCKSFIEHELPEVLLKLDEFKNQNLLKWEIKESKTDFGFMSTIFDGFLTLSDDRK